MAERTLGWIQNPSSFDTLKNVVSVFDKNSKLHNQLLNIKIPSLVKDEDLKNKMLEELKKEPLEMDYLLLKGKGIKQGQKRKDAECTGIIQASIETQKGRKYSDDWTSDGFLRWAISIGFLKYDNENDTVSITELGLKYVNSNNDDEEKNNLITAFLLYPPAVRVLRLLSKQEHLTKFEIGKQLGGLGEAGFTSIPQDLYIQAIETADTKEERTKIRSNTEGSADKYARMICGWLSKVDLVQKADKVVTTHIGDKEYKTIIGHSFRITLKGLKHLKSADGKSSCAKLPKIAYWQMFATKGKDRDYIRNRRANIVLCIKDNKYKTIEEIQQILSDKDIIESKITISDELKVIEAMGLSIKTDKNKYCISDNILHLEVPRTKISKTNVLELKDKVREKLVYVDHRYLGLIDLAYDSNANRDFEIQTIDLLVNELEFDGLRLGESRKPDGLISFETNGVIIDNKAYSKGYNLPINQADEMIRYIEENKTRDKKLNPNEWWKNFSNNVNDFNYLFVTSFLTGNFEKNLDYISNRTDTKGGAINVENLLYLAEELKSGRMPYKEHFNIYANSEIILSV